MSSYLKHFQHIKSLGGIDEYRLKSNGLTVLFREKRSVPVVAVMVTYLVGSRNEAAGHTGATHLLEHLMFKGSKNFNKRNKKQIWSVLEARGARVNATTWRDRTNYYEIMPVRLLEDALAIEADRMHDALIRKKDLDSEMTVVRNEFERGENNPLEALDKAVWASAFISHPYRHPTIGLLSDIENMPIARLRAFYRNFYLPNNAVLSIIGDVRRETAFKLVKKYFGAVQASAVPVPAPSASEPRQEGPRRLIVRRAGQTRIVEIAHKIPEGMSADTPAAHVLAAVLSGGKAGRLHRALVDRGLASEIFIWCFPFHDVGLFSAFAFLTPGTEHRAAEDAIIREYERLKKSGADEKEVKRAKAVILAETAYGRDGVWGEAEALNEAIALGDWTFYTNYPERVSAVSAEDVYAAAKKYLVEDASTTGWFTPKKVS